MRYVLVVIALFACLLMLWNYVPVSATHDEREILKLVAAAMRRDHDCLPLLTDRDGFGGTYGFQSQDERWLNAIYDQTKSRRVRLIVGAEGGVTFAGSFFDRNTTCNILVSIQSPAVRSNVAFVNFSIKPSRTCIACSSFHGSYAFLRSSAGWQLIAGKVSGDGPVF